MSAHRSTKGSSAGVGTTGIADCSRSTPVSSPTEPGTSGASSCRFTLRSTATPAGSAYGGTTVGSVDGSPATSRNCRQCSLTSGDATTCRRSARKVHPHLLSSASRSCPAQNRSACSCSGALVPGRLGQHPGGVLLPSGGTSGTQLGEPASVELLGEGLGREDEMHLDPDERVQRQPDLVLVGDAEVRRGQQRHSLVPPHPVADPRPAPLDLAPGEPGRLVGAEQLVGGQPGLVRRGGHPSSGGLEGLAVGGQVGRNHGSGRVCEPEVPDQLSLRHVTYGDRRSPPAGELRVARGRRAGR